MNSKFEPGWVYLKGTNTCIMKNERSGIKTKNVPIAIDELATIKLNAANTEKVRFLTRDNLRFL
jgi:hypothetical protein